MLRVRGIRFQFLTGFYGFSYPASHTTAAIRCYCTEQTDATKINLMGYILCVAYSEAEINASSSNFFANLDRSTTVNIKISCIRELEKTKY